MAVKHKLARGFYLGESTYVIGHILLRGLGNLQGALPTTASSGDGSNYRKLLGTKYGGR